MLKELQVRNFAVIDDVTVKFGNGLNILTGETGAGKTLIIEAINLLIGERADSDLIRENEEKLIVQGYFDFSKNEKVLNFLKDENILYENESTDDIVISREVNKLGKNRAFINGIFTQVSTLKNLGKNFLDLHGQHDHQSLLDEDTHIDIIDSFGKVDVKNIKPQYQKNYKNFINTKKLMDELLKKQVEKEIRLSDLKYRLDEIEKLKLKENEEEELENEKNVLKNYEKIYNLCSHSISLLNGTETANCQTRQAALIDDLAELKRKYNKSLPEIILYILEIREEINNFENLDNEIEIRKRDFEITRDVLKENALELSEIRNKMKKILEDEIRLELENLNLKTSEFKISNGYIAVEK